MIDPVTVQKIKDTADIVDVVSDYVHLTRRGANYMGLCPFHNERTPSFSVSRSKNFCHCFSCKKGGSPVNFIMEKEGISYHEALLHLAKKYGIEVRERELSNEEREQQTRREGMLIANEWAKNYFISNLHDKEEGKNIGLTYLYGRKVTPEAIKAFQLGYAIDKGNDYTEEALRNGFSLEVLKATGLTGTNQQGHTYDRYRGRVIFPIINTAGKTVAFGARDLKGTGAKYVNSPESEVYYKSRELYGIFQAKGEMVRNDKVYLVEGYLDVIGMWQSGVKNVVASSGTALTDGQIALLHRFTENVVLIYDGDAAGIKASLRGIDMLLAHNLNVKAVPLPEGDDPDSLAAKLTPQQLREYLSENEVDIIRFKINVLLKDAQNDPQKRWIAAKSIVESIANISDKIKRNIYIQDCSSLLNIKEEILSKEVAKARWNIVEQEKLKRRTEALNKENPSATQTSVNTPGPSLQVPENPQTPENNFSMPPSPLFPMEKELLENCLKYGLIGLWPSEEPGHKNEIITVVEYISQELEIDNISFSHPHYARVFQAIKNIVPHFKNEILDHQLSLENHIEQKRKEGYDRIRQKNLSLTEITNEEKTLEEELESFIKTETDRFARNYILDKFGSHEDDVIRSVTNQALVEKHQLSPLFTRNKASELTEETIVNMIIRSLNVLKNGIIDLQLRELMNELKNIDSNDTEKANELYMRINNIIQLRGRMAKDMGERIISPQSLSRT